MKCKQSIRIDYKKMQIRSSFLFKIYVNPKWTELKFAEAKWEMWLSKFWKHFQQRNHFDYGSYAQRWSKIDKKPIFGLLLLQKATKEEVLPKNNNISLSPIQFEWKWERMCGNRVKSIQRCNFKRTHIFCWQMEKTGKVMCIIRSQRSKKMHTNK